MTTKFTPLEIEIILDRPEECIGSTMDRAEEVSPQYHGKVRAAARRCVEKLEKLNVKFSWAERWF
mgnify:CR=1 FL=1